MTMQQATPRTTTGTMGRVLALTVAGAITLAVAAVSIGTWQGARPRAATDASSSAPAPLPARDAMAGREAERATAARTAPPTVYIAATEAQAQAERAANEEANVLRATVGESPLDTQVVWFDAPEAEVHFWVTQAAMQPRDGGSGAARAVIDLRGQ